MSFQGWTVFQAPQCVEHLWNPVVFESSYSLAAACESALYFQRVTEVSMQSKEFMVRGRVSNARGSLRGESCRSYVPANVVTQSTSSNLP